MVVREADNRDLYARIQERNLLRQYDLLTNCVEIVLSKGIDAFDKYMLWSLNAAAVANIAQFGGRFRRQPIYVGRHTPPHFDDVPELVDEFLSVIHETIHPFIEGNGRTARAACYLLICVRNGALLPGKKIVPERIRENREPYYAALQAADRHWANGHFNVEELADYLAGLLKDQLLDA